MIWLWFKSAAHVATRLKLLLLLIKAPLVNNNMIRILEFKYQFHTSHFIIKKENETLREICLSMCDNHKRITYKNLKKYVKIRKLLDTKITY